MSHIVLFHSALGLRPAVVEFADALRARGHLVETPDYYAGRVFERECEGIAYRDEIGVPALMDRARTALDTAPDDAVLVGFSLGAFFAQAFADKRPATRAAILLHSAETPRRAWNGVPVQVHRYADDPWIEPDDVIALRDAVTLSGGSFEDFVVPGRGHLFTDLATPDGDETALHASIRTIDALLSVGRA